MKNASTIIDIGSSKIRGLSGISLINGQMKILAEQEVDYDGFLDGQFFDAQKVFLATKECLTNLRQTLKAPLGKIFVGVPGAFCTLIEREIEVEFEKSRKIGKLELEELTLLAKQQVKTQNFELIERHFSNFHINGRETSDILGKKCDSLKATLCMVYCEKSFVSLFSQILNDFGIKVFQFVSSNIATSNFFFDRLESQLILDIGYLTTNIFVKEGDGLSFLKTIDVGGGHITGDLLRVFNLDFKTAEELKRNIKLTDNEKFSYLVTVKKEQMNLAAHEVNRVVRKRLDSICNSIKQCLDENNIDLLRFFQINLTGGGVSLMSGATDYLFKSFSMPIEVLATSSVLDVKKTSAYAVLHEAIKQEAKKTKFFEKIFN